MSSQGSGPAQRCPPGAFRSVLLLLIGGAPAAPAPAHPAGCVIGRLAELPVTMDGMSPMVHAKINGTEALFLADSGAFFNTLTPSAAAQFNLRLEPAPYHFTVRGIGGAASTWVTRIKMFTIFDLQVPNVEFFVAGSGLHSGAVGVLGQNVFRIADVEYDLANGVIRLMRPHDCKKAAMAYWANDKPVSAMDIEFATPLEPHTTGTAYLNGSRIRVMFDTGASTSAVSLDAAKRAGIEPRSAGVTPGGFTTGFGPSAVPTWIAPFTSLKIGDEEIRNTQLRIADLNLMRMDIGMLIGADFFLSHRIYVANSQHRLYFTYNGGPVFNLTTGAAAAPAGADADLAGTEPSDAAGFARRGNAFAARRDYEHALADLSRACELAPTEASYFYERGRVHWYSRQPEAALEDFDTALKLKPDDVPSLIARARARAHHHDPVPGIVADLDAADRAASRQAEARLDLAELYEYAGNLPAAILQYTAWIDAHQPDDVRMAGALNSRCWLQGLLGQTLDRALADCNGALRLKPKTPGFLDSRGLVYLRRGSYDKAIADYDSALRAKPDIAWSLYGRGIARLRKGQMQSGQADLAAASALKPNIAEEAARHGITP